MTAAPGGAPDLLADRNRIASKRRRQHNRRTGERTMGREALNSPGDKITGSGLSPTAGGIRDEPLF